MKLKTHKTTSKRIRITGSGKLQQPTTSAQHLRHNKSNRILAAAKGYKITAKGNARKFIKLLPYI
ncbi:50S ribosomal protein L35 [Patescibacteria group bacterium]|nr:50S ribosomal protein L35 [Patescibacteria group bacterium]